MGYYNSNTPKALKELLKDFIDDYPHRKELKRGMVLSLWSRVVGQKIAEQTEHVHFEGNRLIVHVKNPIWRHEIHMNRFSIASKLNKEVKEKIVKEIVVRS